MTTASITDEVRAFSTDEVTVTCEQKGSRLYIRMRDKAAARVAKTLPKSGLFFLNPDSEEIKTMFAANARQDALFALIRDALRGRFSMTNRGRGFHGAARNLCCFFDAD